MCIPYDSDKTPPPPLLLNLGCGRNPLPGYVNIDVKPGVGVDLVTDLTRLWEVYAPNSVHGIVSYHALEHLTETDGLAVLRVCRRILIPNGTLYVEMPEFDRIVRNYLYRHTPMSKHRIFGLGRDQWDYHRWGYNYVELAEVLRGIGFVGVRRMKARDHHSVNNMCFGIEARKKGDKEQ